MIASFKYFMLTMLLTTTLSIFGFKHGSFMPMKPPTPEELAEAEELLKTLPPDVVKQLEELGNELINEAQRTGKPLFYDPEGSLSYQLPETTPAKKETPPAPVPEKPRPAPTLSGPSKKVVSSLQKLINDLLDDIAEIRQKISLHEKSAKIIQPLEDSLNKLTHYLNVIVQKKHVGRLTEKEFEILVKNITQLSMETEQINAQLDIPDATMDLSLNTQERIAQEDRKKTLLERAERHVKNFFATYSQAFEKKKIIQDIEKLIKKYEPEALEMKKKQQEQITRAHGQAKRLPITNVGFSSPLLPSKTPPVALPSYNKKGGQLTTLPSSATPSPTGNIKPTPKPAGGKSSSPGGSSSAKKPAPKDKATGDTKKDDEKKDELKITKEIDFSDQANELKKKITEVTSYVASQRTSIEDFFRYLTANVEAASLEEQRRMERPLGELQFKAVRLKKAMSTWTDNIAKSADWQKAQNYRDHMQEFINKNCNDIDNLIERIDTFLMVNSPYTPRIESHKDDLKDLTKTLKELKNIKIRAK